MNLNLGNKLGDVLDVWKTGFKNLLNLNIYLSKFIDQLQERRDYNY